jgi:hypothetical protein
LSVLVRCVVFVVFVTVWVVRVSTTRRGES